MSDLTNSTRTLHKATYVPIQATEREADQLRRSPGRAFQKLNLVRALAPTVEELKALRPRRGEPATGAAATRKRAIDALVRAHAANDVNSVSTAQILAPIDAEALADVADALIAERKKTGALVSNTLDTIRQRIAQRGPGAPAQDVRAFAARATTAVAAEFSVPELLNWAAANEPRLLSPISNTVLLRDADHAPTTFAQRRLPVALYDDAALHEVGLALAGFRQSMRIEPIGRLHLERLEMYPVSLERGELVGTVPLAPQETVTVSHKEWSTTSDEFENIVEDFFEGYSEKGVAEKNDASMASESESKHSNSFTFGAAVSGGYVGVTVSTSLNLAQSSDDRESLKRSTTSSREVTQKASARTRKEHKVTFKLEAKRGTQDETFRVITNPSPTASMRVDYFRLMRKWRTDLFRYGLRMTYDIVIPNPGAALWGRYEELAAIERELNEPLQFGITTNDITEVTWTALASQFKANVEPPPLKTIRLSEFRELREPSGGMTSIEFMAPDGYSLDSNVICEGSYVLLGPPNLGIAFSGNALVNITPGGSVSDAGIFEAKITGALHGGHKSALFISYGSGQVIGVNAITAANRLDSTFEAWRVRALQTMQEGALRAYVTKAEKLRERRDQLLEELSKFDALTLRRMEREEIIRGTLQWLFGPQFKLAPPAIATVVESILAGATSFSPPAGDLEKLSDTQWSDVLSFGEFVKFLHQAVEWENMLFLLYPYFWGSATLAQRKRFFMHSDPLHRDFLRAGFARVVLTIRPGFEQAFTQLLETGAFGTLSGAHPYMTIASEIASYAKTNYPGIPPANSEKNARPLLYPEQRATWTDMQRIVAMLEAFRTANGRYPAALSELTGGPFQDFWGNPYVYRMPGRSGEYDLISLGADGEEGGDDLDADISAAADASLVARWFDYTPTSGIDIQLNSGLATIA